MPIMQSRSLAEQCVSDSSASRLAGVLLEWQPGDMLECMWCLILLLMAVAPS
jgi:hypothetical protein